MKSETQSNTEFWIEQAANRAADLQPSGFGDFRVQSELQHKQHLFDASPLMQDALKGLSHEFGVTPRSCFVAAVNLLLWKYTGLSDAVLAATFTDDDPQQAQLYLRRVRLQADTELREYLICVDHELRQESSVSELMTIGVSDAIRHDMAWKMSRNHLGTAVTWGVPTSLHRLLHVFDLHVFADRESGKIGAVFNAQYFEEAIVERFLANLASVVSQLSRLSSTRLGDITVVCEAEQRELASFNATGRDYPRDRTIPELFEDVAGRFADKPAVVTSVSEMTYGELNAQANRAAAFLRNCSLQRGQVVAVLANRGVNAIICYLAVLKAGGCFLPINVRDPIHRQQFLLDASGALGVIAADGSTPAINFTGLRFSASLPNEILSDDSLSDSDSPLHSHSTDSAYVMYTSGTSGKPKGVVVEHRGVVRLVRNSDFFEPCADDRILQTGAFEFDASTFEIWCPLLNGLTLYLAHDEDVLSPSSLRKLIEQWQITTMWLTSPLFSQLAAADTETFSKLRTLLVGGDRVSPRHINAVRRSAPNLRVINGYGPTENTTFSTTFTVDQECGASVPIGGPIANSTAYVVDSNGQLAPLGVIGELYVGGDGVARGYLGDPELTSSCFVEFADESRVYRTGDLARWNNDGNLEFFGRTDDQLKIRGYRVDPAAVEVTLREHPDVKDVAVFGISDGDSDSDKQLCAFVIARGKMQSKAAKKHLAEFLPDYQIPARFAFVDEFPLTPHGKIDRNRLAEVLHVSDESISRPDVSPQLLTIWNDVLGKSAGAETENFFDAGGHSMMAIALLSRIQKEYGIEVTLREFLRSPTLTNLEEQLRTTNSGEIRKIRPQPMRPFCHLSMSQKRLSGLCDERPESAAFNIVLPKHWPTRVDFEVVREVLTILATRHESLRTRLEKRSDGYVQIIDAESEIELDVVDLNRLPLDGKRQERARILEFERRIPVRLDAARLWRAKLIIYSPEESELILTIHHIICDGWSLDILNREFDQVFSDLTSGRSPSLPDVALQFRDYVEWHNEFLSSSEQSRTVAEFWKRTLREPPPRVTFPHDRAPFSDEMSHSSSGYRSVLPTALTRQLRSVAGSNQTSLFMVLFAAYNLLLRDLSRAQDLIIGIPSANRSDPDIQNTVGFIVDSVIIRTRVESAVNFSEFLRGVSDHVLVSLENAHYPVELACSEVDTTWPQIMATFFNMSTFGDSKEQKIEDLRSFHLPKVQEAKLEFVVYLAEFANGVDVQAHYYNECFSPECVEQYMVNYLDILESVAADPFGRRI